VSLNLAHPVYIMWKHSMTHSFNVNGALYGDSSVVTGHCRGM